MNLAVKLTNGTIKRFKEILYLDAKDEKSVCERFHVEPQKVRMKTLESQQIRPFYFDENGKTCDQNDECYYTVSTRKSEKFIEEIKKHLRKRKEYIKPFDIVIPPKTWLGYKSSKELEMYAKEIGGHIADTTEWAL